LKAISLSFGGQCALTKSGRAALCDRLFE